MLILSFVGERENDVKKKRYILRKKRVRKNELLNRYSMIVKGKSVLVLELNEPGLKSEDVQMLLKMYKGRVLVSEKYKNHDELRAYLYSPKAYYQRALLSSLVNQIRNINKEWGNICIKTDDFYSFKELYELVRITKNVVIIGERNNYTDKFIKDCFYEYGAIVSVRNDCFDMGKCIVVDLDEIDDSKKLLIKVCSKEFVLYSDARFFESCQEYQKLMPFDLAFNEICAVFSDK